VEVHIEKIESGLYMIAFEEWWSNINNHAGG